MRKICCLFIVTALFCVFPPLWAQEPRVLRVAIDRDYPPFFYIDETGEFAGVSVDFWKLWEEKTGIPVELFPLPWEKAHEVMKACEAEVIDTIFWTPERELYLDFAGPLFPITSSVYFRRGLSISSLFDLTPHVVGAKSRDALVDYASSQNPAIHLRLFLNYSDIVSAAKRGEIDCFLMDDPPAYYYLVQYGLLGEFSRLPLPILNHLYLATWKGNTEVLALLKEGLAKFSKKEIDSLLKPYMIEIRTYPPWLWKAILALALGVVIFIGVLLAFNRLLKWRIAQATEELLLKTKALEEAEQKILKTVEVAASLPLFSLSETEFFSAMLDLALELIPKARAGGAFLVDQDGKGTIVAIRGHSQDLIGFTFEKEDLIVAFKPEVFRGFLDPERKFSSPERFKTFTELALPIAETLLIPLLWKEELFGFLSLDILEGEKVYFDAKDLFLAECLSRICLAFHALREYAQKEEGLLRGLLLVLSQTLEYYDGYTQAHSAASAEYAFEVAQLLGLERERACLVHWAALVHDVGKIFIPQSILRKPGRLTPEEYSLVQLHPQKGAELLSKVEDLEPVARIVRHHHERFDGMGYPDGLKGEEIPLESRIVAVVDAFEAMTSERPYRKAMSVEEALEELKRCAGTQFDPRVVRIMLLLVGEKVQHPQEKS